MAKTMTAKYAGVCTTCSQRFTAGTEIRYAGRGQTSHVSCTPVTSGEAFTATGEAEYRARSAKRSRRYSPGKYAYTSTGARMTMSSQRCEDAPCCGCCD